MKRLSELQEIAIGILRDHDGRMPALALARELKVSAKQMGLTNSPYRARPYRPTQTLNSLADRGLIRLDWIDDETDEGGRVRGWILVEQEELEAAISRRFEQGR